MINLDMTGHIDHIFQSVPATRTSHTGGSYIAGHWTEGTSTATTHTVTVQPMTDKELDFLKSGGERIADGRKIYVNDGASYNLAESDTWTFTGIDGTFKAIRIDNRPWRAYARIMVSRLDS